MTSSKCQSMKEFSLELFSRTIMDDCFFIFTSFRFATIPNTLWSWSIWFIDFILFVYSLCWFVTTILSLKPTVTESTVVRSKASFAVSLILSKVISSRSALDVGAHGSSDVLCLDLSIGRILHSGEFDRFSLLFVANRQGKWQEIEKHNPKRFKMAKTEKGNSIRELSMAKIPFFRPLSGSNSVTSFASGEATTTTTKQNLRPTIGILRRGLLFDEQRHRLFHHRGQWIQIPSWHQTTWRFPMWCCLKNTEC